MLYVPFMKREKCTMNVESAKSAAELGKIIKYKAKIEKKTKNF